MTSETAASTMNQDATTALVPKLRFPEFRETSGWKFKLIGPYLEDCSGRVPPETNLPIYSSTREGLKRQDTYFDGRVLQNKNEYGVVPRGCFVYRHMSDDGLFKFNINGTGGEIAVSKEYPVFRTKGLNSVFLLAKLNDGLDFKYFALSQKAGGTRTRLYFSRLCEWRTLLPSFAEQQKIAACLSSLDELIAAQAQKVEALKTHKKGLMQQLFPREGETQPRLRFLEFRDSGKWEPKMLVEACGMRAGKFVSAAEIKELDGVGMFPCYGGNGLRGFTETYTHDGTYPLIGRQGALCGNVKFATGKFHATEHAIVATPKRSVEVVWLYYLLNLLNLNRFATGQAQPGLSVDVLEKVPVTIPGDKLEQQRIASCLRSLDTLITAENQKLEALKTHKKSLMQQLFPSTGVDEP
jgi:type I restriction enzyme S subunit